MKKITWVNFLHIYQPSWQDPDTVRQITRESYEFLVMMLKRHHRIRATFNISGTLLTTLEALGYHELLADLVSLVKQGQIELTGTAHFHAFLPELPASEIDRQIKLQEETMEKYFPGWKKDGFFLPEMAYTPEVGKVIADRGYGWIILDPMSAGIEVKTDVRYQDRVTGLTVLFRNRRFSKSYPPEKIYTSLKGNGEETIITATDGEMYGHFHQDWQKHLKQTLESEAITVLTVNDYLKTLTKSETIELRQASWETRRSQLAKNNPFSIWYNKSNPIHRQLWSLAHDAMRIVNDHVADPNFFWARTHLDQGLASCSFWWASDVKTSAFAPVAWNPDEVEKGAQQLIKSIRSLHTLALPERLSAEKKYHALLESLWKRHWRKHSHT